MSERLLAGRYRLEGPIGSGGMAQVHRGTDTVLGRPVAIKILSPRYAGDAEFVARFRREAQAAARLNHPNVVGVYDTGSDDGTHYIVMEYVEGRTLADFLARDGRLPAERAVELAEAVCRALAVAHAQGVIHRDVKPGNIMVTRDGRVKVMDFGIARLADGADTVAQTAAVLGTASYLSPEQARGEPVDARSDLYSLGVVLYEMLTGRPPFTGDSPVAVAFKHVNEAPTPPSKLAPDVPPDLEAVVMRCLAKNPANRYASAEELLADLERVRTGRPVEATPLLPDRPTAVLPTRAPAPTAVLPPGEGEPEEGRGRRILVGIVATLAVLALLGAGLYVALRALLGEEQAARVVVPSVIGDALGEATARIEARGLDVGNVDEVFCARPPGVVCRQDPRPGERVPRGAEVDLFLSKGPRPVVVPDLTGMSQQDAEAALERRDLQLGTVTPREVDPAEAEPGTIVDQFPEAGQPVPPGTAVDVVVAVAPSPPPTPATVTVPPIVCESQGKAESELRKLGLGWVYGEPRFNEACPQEGKIAAVDPPEGSSVAQGSTVTLYPTTSVPPTSPPPEGD
ncbi:MAG TPA: Stk1 family PASTA domain-containing Ser/Thr kinase [Actinomycetota bacterium]|nr:Stk1 family PASTA domain-containing Ser/Thr kinase [Actinomycetota bacterium]